MNQVTLPRADFKDVFIALDKGKYQPCHLVSETTPSMLKTNNPYADGNLVKVQERNLFIGMDYQNRIWTEEEKQGLVPQFQTEETWFRHITKTLVHHKDDVNRLYLMFEQFQEIPPIKTEYFYKGQPIEKRMFEQFLKDYTASKKQVQNRKVMPLTYSFESIKSITINKTKYTLI